MTYGNKTDLITKYLIPNKIICCEKVYNTEILKKHSSRQPVLADVDTCIFSPGGYIVLDFGEELCGGVDITTHDFGGDASLHIVFGESLMEALSEFGDKNSTNDHAIRDSIVPIKPFSNFRVGQTGFRFVKIQALNVSVNISGIMAACDIRDIPYRGSFESDDDKLNRIWKTGARTVHLCMQDYLWDGIKRDRLVWLGDMHAEVSAIGAVFGDNKIVDDTLEYMMSVTPPEQWMNTIPSYSLWWVIIKRDWYYQTGNLQTLINDRDYILKSINHIAMNVNDDGTDRFDSWGVLSSNPYSRYFIDWESYGTEESKNGFYAVLMLALNAGCELCDILGDEHTKRICLQKMAAIKKMTFCETKNMQMVSLMALAGMIDAEIANKEFMTENSIRRTSAYLGYYTLLAKAQANDINGGLEIVKGYWGRMLELGATTFWESFDYTDSLDALGIDEIVPNGKKDVHGDGGSFCYTGFRKSLCHGWACGPTPFLSRCVLGINPIEPGFRKVRIKPQLGTLQYLKGTYPTPYGDIIVIAEQKSGVTNTKITAPNEIEVIR